MNESKMKQQQPPFRGDVRDNGFHWIQTQRERQYWEHKQPYRNDCYSDDRMEREDVKQDA